MIANDLKVKGEQKYLVFTSKVVGVQAFKNKRICFLVIFRGKTFFLYVKIKK